MSLDVTVVPCLVDNYAYVFDDGRGGAVVVDPSEADPVARVVRARGGALAAILCTHHHPDHVGGVEELLDAFGAGVPVYGHASEGARIPRLSAPLAHEQTFALGALAARALHVPGHTTGALAYVIDDAVFTGDTMFVAGCGRLFEGTAAMMHHALDEVIGALPPSTRVFPGHEYAEKNLRFAATVVEPGSAEVRARYDEARRERAAGRLVVPSTIALERATNPFLRTRAAGPREFARSKGADEHDPVAVLAAVRTARDGF
jgi:hydroxyacylglutathione hydrolase